MTNEDFDSLKREYQWNQGYSRENEYDKNPDWAVEARAESIDGGVKVYDSYDPEHMWIKSDTVYDLTNCL